MWYTESARFESLSISRHSLGLKNLVILRIISENIPTVEDGAEKNPNEREVFNQFEIILGAREFEEMSKVEDEQGLYSWDIKTTEEGTGDRVDIGYARSKIFADGTVRPPKIHQTLYYGDVPCGAGAQFDYEGGEWVEKS